MDFRRLTHTFLVLTVVVGESIQLPVLTPECPWTKSCVISCMFSILWVRKSQFLFRLEDMCNSSYKPSLVSYLGGFWMPLGESRSHSPIRCYTKSKRQRDKAREGGGERGLWWPHSERWIFVWQLIKPLRLKWRLPVR